MLNGIDIPKKINVAFMGEYSSEWMGGVNYLKNLLYSLSKLQEKKIRPIVFMGMKADPLIINSFKPYAQVVQDEMFDRKSAKRFLSRVLEKVFKSSIIRKRLLDRYNVDVISHSNFTLKLEGYKKINWIPDFQHLHLPELFSKKELEIRTEGFTKFLRVSDVVIVSSHDAYNDCVDFSPEFIDKVRVLQFVSQPKSLDKVERLSGEHRERLEKKFEFSGNYFYIPNQFWKHKNHFVVFEAVKLLKEKGIDVLILCSGHMDDYRHPEYVNSLQRYVEDFQLQDNIKFLGLIEYDDVLYLMQHSLAVINPSSFEGWSSTVEECKSMGKNMILSDIPIHREQNPLNSSYFNLYDASDLAEVMNNHLDFDFNLNTYFEELAFNQLSKRTLDFAEKYQEIVLKSLSDTRSNVL